jgi:hypothetical protein
VRRFRLSGVAIVSLLVILHPPPARAQGAAHGYVFLGAGLAGAGIGVDWNIAGPAAVGCEVAGGNFLALSFGGAYHFLDRRRFERLDLFARVAYTAMTDLNTDAVGATVGGGAVYWPRRHVGLRLDWISFLPARDDIHPEDRVHWGARAGVAFGWR